MWQAATGQNEKGRRPKPTPIRTVKKPLIGYGFFAAHVFVAASHTPPAFVQSASVFAVVTSPAKAGAVKASAIARANMEVRPFMAFSPLR
jgi:hypothetical protein